MKGMFPVDRVQEEIKAATEDYFRRHEPPAKYDAGFAAQTAQRLSEVFIFYC